MLVLTLRTAEATISNRSSTICSGRASVVGPSEEPVDAGRRATSSSDTREAQRKTGRSNSSLKNRLARAAKMIGVKPTTAP
jgi:hypothetical protein